MPIRPEQRARYPKNWDEISKRIRNKRAGGRCECDGRCGHDHTEVVFQSPTGWRLTSNRCAALNSFPHPVTGSKVVLTVAHLNHKPEDNREENLLAMCQRCHLAHDREEHARVRAERKASPF